MPPDGRIATKMEGNSAHTLIVGNVLLDVTLLI